MSLLHDTKNFARGCVIAKVGCRFLAILNFDVILNIRQMNIHIEMDQGVKKLGPHNIDPKFHESRILSRNYEVPFFSLPDPFLYVYSFA